MYRSLSLALAVALAAPLSQAMAGVRVDSDQCEVSTDYDFRIEPERLVFTREGRELAFAGGRVWHDGQPLSVNGADAARVAEFERAVRALVPEVKAIARDGLAIAHTALSKVIESFASESNRAAFIAELDAMRSEIDGIIERAQSSSDFDDRVFEERVQALASRLAPRIAGEIASQAVAAAMRGDEAEVAAIEARAERFEKDIEASVEGQARALEARADALCPRIKELDRIEEGFELRLPDGRPLELIEVAAR